MEDFRTGGTVSGGQILDNKFSTGRPIGRRNAPRCWLGLLFDVAILLNPLQARCSGDQNRLSVQGIDVSHLFPLTSNSFKDLIHHMIIPLNATAMFNEKPTFAADPGSWMASVPYTK